MSFKNRAIEVRHPEKLLSPVIFASPHSGRVYPDEFLSNARLDRHALRQSEDAYVDLLFNEAPRFGSPFLQALFPRAYVDVNRSRLELDARMFADAIPKTADTRSNRVIAGLGVIPRIVADGQDIYNRKLYYIDAKRRLAACYDPYHAALGGLVEKAKETFGCAIVIDCHSMPSLGGGPFRPNEDPIDFVLGDRFGVSCAPSLSHRVEQSLIGLGYRVARNAPYAGGHVASRYGQPKSGVHVLQIEINRALYLDERRIMRNAQFDEFKHHISALMETIIELRAEDVWSPLAAE